MFARSSAGGYLAWMVFTFFVLGSTVLFFPHLLKGLVLATAGGRCSGGVCGAIGVVFGIYLKSFLILIGVVFAVVGTWKRVRGVLSVWWAVFAGSAVWGAGTFLFAAGNFWGANFAVGILYAPAPWSLLALIVLTALLSLDMERVPGFDGRIAALTGPSGLPIGAIYVASAIWLSVTVMQGLVTMPVFSLAMTPYFALAKALYGMHLGWLLSPFAAAVTNSVAGALLVVILLTGGRNEAPTTPAVSG